MRKFVIVTDSCSDLEKELRKKYEIEYVPMSMTIDDKDYTADLDWGEIPAKAYYELMRNGTRITTSQVNADTYRKAFTKYLDDGCDILSISCSSALSSSVKTSYAVRDELKAKYPDAKIICIDSLISCYGLGALCIIASEMRANGKTIDEVAEWIEAHKLEVHQLATVNDLKFLKWSGRITATKAMFGALFNVKPIIISDAKGHNASVEKAKGRKASLDRVVELFKEQYRECDCQRIFIGHADCVEDAEYLKKQVLEVCPNKNLDVHIGYIGPIVGASVGPSMIGLFFFGDKITYSAEE